MRKCLHVSSFSCNTLKLTTNSHICFSGPNSPVTPSGYLCMEVSEGLIPTPSGKYPITYLAYTACWRKTGFWRWLTNIAGSLARSTLCNMSHVMRKPVFALCEQQWPRSACASAQSDQCLCYSLLRWYNICSFYMQNLKPLASRYSWVGQFVSYQIWNPVVRVSHDKAHMSHVMKKLVVRFSTR